MFLTNLDDFHIWHQNSHYYVWASLYQVFCETSFLVQLIWLFDIWHLLDNLAFFGHFNPDLLLKLPQPASSLVQLFDFWYLTSFWQFDLFDILTFWHMTYYLNHLSPSQSYFWIFAHVSSLYMVIMVEIYSLNSLNTSTTKWKTFDSCHIA